MLKEFGIEEDARKKRDVLTTCDKLWRDFKSRLVTRWITKTRKGFNNDTQPFVLYPFITQEIWDQFAKKCISKEFKVANKHLHFLDQKSYAEMIPIRKRKGYIPSSSTASSVDSSTSLVVSSLSDRTLPCLLARSKKDKNENYVFHNEETQKMKEPIDDWKSKENEGEFVSRRMDGALSRVLQSKDHFERVLTAENSIEITSVWGDPDQSSTARKGRGMDDEEMQALEARVTKRVREQTIKEMNSKIDALVQERIIFYAAQLGMPVPNQTRKNPHTPVGL